MTRYKDYETRINYIKESMNFKETVMYNRNKNNYKISEFPSSIVSFK